MSTQHTAGPWHWDAKVWDYDPENDAPWLVDTADRRVLWGGIKCDSEADARLIAAAPSLLMVLMDLLDDYVAGGNSGDWGNWDPEEQPQVIAARAAIAKATGDAA